MSQPTLINCPACKAQVSNQAPSCPRCGQPIAGRNYQPSGHQQTSPPAQPAMFQQAASRAAPQRGVGQKLGLGCLALFGLIFLAGILGSITNSNRGDSASNQAARSNATPAAAASTNEAKKAETKTNGAVALANFRKKVLSVPAGRQLISKIELGVVPGVLNIYVNNAWYDGETYQRRQLTTQFVTLWQQELGTDTVIVHIYDMTEHEVAGSKFMGGVWVEDE